MRSVQNIQKITSAMKMVAASKMRVAQAATEVSRGLARPLLRILGDTPDADVEKNLTVAITTDKGLCGGINSAVTKYSRAASKAAAGTAEGKVMEYVVVGEKGKSQLQRTDAASIAATVADVAKVRTTFGVASAVAEILLKTEYDAARIVFNRFVSAIAFKPTVATVLSPAALERAAAEGGSLDAYEIEGPDRAELLQDLAEFGLAATLYNCLLENSCSEQAARMSAMESSTKNASEILAALTLKYNRSRQSAITTELIEIISGAAALEG
jgi:F-type H+-transporting ATPase subunit gamma